MKTTQLITDGDIDQLMTAIDLLDELRQALISTYLHKVEEYRKQHWLERQEQCDNLDMFDDEIPF